MARDQVRVTTTSTRTESGDGRRLGTCTSATRAVALPKAPASTRTLRYAGTAPQREASSRWGNAEKTLRKRQPLRVCLAHVLDLVLICLLFMCAQPRLPRQALHKFGQALSRACVAWYGRGGRVSCRHCSEFGLSSPAHPGLTFIRCKFVDSLVS